ncbi:MAG: NAD-dependent epimerase/dehydratase family protein, partial [Lewinella sp.]|nr:NAD-dependent epimerase/dehydratase family protein [Lewinella sp.]
MSQGTILLTGGSGFIGHYVTKCLLAAGYKLRLLLRSNSDISHLSMLNFESFNGDLLDIASLEDALEGCSAVVHLAALVSFLPQDRLALERVNTSGTANIVNAALAVGVPRLVYLSSVAALDRSGPGPITEQNRWPTQPPLTAYAASKFGAEREVWRGQGEGLSVAALYPSIVLGAGAWKQGGTPALFDRAAQGRRSYPLGATGFVDVRDVAEAVLTVVNRQQDGDRFLLNAINLTWQGFFTAVSQEFGHPAPRWAVPAWMSGLAWPMSQ